jgi:hypothetical protein
VGGITHYHPSPSGKRPVRSDKLSNIETARFDPGKVKLWMFKKYLLQTMVQKILLHFLQKKVFENQKFCPTGIELGGLKVA